MEQARPVRVRISLKDDGVFAPSAAQCADEISVALKIRCVACCVLRVVCCVLRVVCCVSVSVCLCMCV